MGANKLLSSHELPNGLILTVWDRSHPVVGDRWQVVLEGRITIPVNDRTLPPELSSRAQEVIRALGPDLVFTRREERNFIATGKAAAILQEMTARLLELAPRYLGHPDFAARFIRQKFKEYLERQCLNNQ
ncbi:MAG: hypothetical protein FJ134_11410 [Deltaproteobacteria bacterium]|nr:hypothetical protein [Deltaproteobacteria bacterium]